MAGTLKTYDPEWTLLSSIAMGLATTPAGISTDGDGGLWVVDLYSLYHCRINNGAFHIDRVIAGTSLGIRGFTNFSGVTTDGENLILGVQLTVGGPFVTKYYTVYVVNRRMAAVKALSSLSTGSFAAMYDLTYMGRNVVVLTSVNTFPAQFAMKYGIYQRNKVAKTYKDTLKDFRGIAWNGRTFFVVRRISGAPKGTQISKAKQVLTPAVALLVPLPTAIEYDGRNILYVH